MSHLAVLMNGVEAELKIGNLTAPALQDVRFSAIVQRTQEPKTTQRQVEACFCSKLFDEKQNWLNFYGMVYSGYSRMRTNFRRTKIHNHLIFFGENGAPGTRRLRGLIGRAAHVVMAGDFGVGGHGDARETRGAEAADLEPPQSTGGRIRPSPAPSPPWSA